MGGIDVFQSQDVAKVAFKPPPPPVQEPEVVQAQDITATPPPAEDVTQIETGKGTPSEIAIVTVTPSTPITPPPPTPGDWFWQPETATPTPPTTPPPGDLYWKPEKPADPPPTNKPPVQPPAKPPVQPPVQPPAKPPVQPPAKPPAKPPAEKPVPASGRTFKTQGDPIVKTGDGLQYSMNVPGKYVSLMSKSGDFKMEQTITKTPGNRHYNTGMDFHVGKNNISFDANGGKNPATMTINGQKVDLKFTAFSKTLADGTKLSYDPKTNKIDITSPQGDHITVQRAWNDQKTHYLNATVELSDKRPAGSVYGALGTLDADDNAANDARMRDGSVYKGPIGDMWKTPEDFLKEWRVK